MSDYLQQNVHYLDETTHFIIHGYFRERCTSLTVPLDIIYVTTLFVDDHFILTEADINGTLMVIYYKK